MFMKQYKKEFLSWLSERRLLYFWLKAKRNALYIEKNITSYELHNKDINIDYIYKGKQFNRKMVNIGDYILARYPKMDPVDRAVLCAIYTYKENYKTMQWDYLFLIHEV